MKHYRAIVLIMDNTNNMFDRKTNYDPQVYLMNKNIWKKYMNTVDDILCMFVCNNEKLEYGHYQLDLPNNTIYVHGIETVAPGITEKTLYSLIYLKEHFTFDYIIRTALNAFFVLPEINKFLVTLPTEKVFRGYVPFGDFVSGIAMYMTPDIVDIFISNTNYLIEYGKNNNMYDDVLFSHFLINNFGIKLISDKFHNFDSNNIDNIDNEIKELQDQDIIQYRIKNPDDRIKYDTYILDKLCKYYYNK